MSLSLSNLTRALVDCPLRPPTLISFPIRMFSSDQRSNANRTLYRYSNFTVCVSVPYSVTVKGRKRREKENPISITVTHNILITRRDD